MRRNIKVCKKCGAEKPLSEYYKSGSGTEGSCKDCRKEGVRQNRKIKIEHYREYDRKRGNRQDISYLKEYRNQYPNKYKAHSKVNNALRDGKLTKKQFCEYCEVECNTVGHHHDYLKPLEVVWLCQGCHVQWHKDNGEGKNAK